MKKQGKELASAAETSCREKAGITRRAFLKGTAGFVLLCGSGFGLGGILADTRAEEETPVGPQLIKALSIKEEASGAVVTAGGETCFTVNQAGARLLQLADGRRTLNEIILASGLEEEAEAVADFFLALGAAGYLTARLEVNKVAVRL